jgi:hypothetical protein
MHVQTELVIIVCRRLIDSINNLACQNTAVIRTAMKNRGLFDLRDTLIIRMLRGEGMIIVCTLIVY